MRDGEGLEGTDEPWEGRKRPGRDGGSMKGTEEAWEGRRKQMRDGRWVGALPYFGCDLPTSFAYNFCDIECH